MAKQTGCRPTHGGCWELSFNILLRLFLILPVLFSRLRAATASSYSKTFTMSDFCNDMLDMQGRHLTAVHLRLMDRPLYRPHMKCSLGVRAPPGLRLLMVVEWMDIKPGLWGMCSDFLSVYDGNLQNMTGPVKGLDDTVCGQSSPPPVKSQGNDLVLHFDSNSIHEGAGFYITITSFHTGSCLKTEFGCDNGLCIDQRLACDAHDNCGDGSDDCILSTGQVVVAVIVTSILFLLIVGGALLYCHKDKLRLKFKKKCPTIEANPDGVYQPTTEPVTPGTSATTVTEATTAV